MEGTNSNKLFHISEEVALSGIVGVLIPKIIKVMTMAITPSLNASSRLIGNGMCFFAILYNCKNVFELTLMEFLISNQEFVCSHNFVAL